MTYYVPEFIYVPGWQATTYLSFQLHFQWHELGSSKPAKVLCIWACSLASSPESWLLNMCQAPPAFCALHKAEEGLCSACPSLASLRSGGLSHPAPGHRTCVFPLRISPHTGAGALAQALGSGSSPTLLRPWGTCFHLKTARLKNLCFSPKQGRRVFILKFDH